MIPPSSSASKSVDPQGTIASSQYLLEHAGDIPYGLQNRIYDPNDDGFFQRGFPIPTAVLEQLFTILHTVEYPSIVGGSSSFQVDLSEKVDTVDFGLETVDESNGGGLLDLFDRDYPIGSLALAAFCALLFHWQSIGNFALENFSLCPIRILENRECYRFITHTFLHHSSNHLVNNMIGMFLHGKECELIYGTLRLSEAIVWAIAMEIPWVLLFCALPFHRFRHSHAAGFSGVLYFWIGMIYSELDAWGKLHAAFLVYEDARLFRLEKGSLAHLVGALNGLLYAKFCVDRFTLPTPILRVVEERLEYIRGFLPSRF